MLKILITSLILLLNCANFYASAAQNQKIKSTKNAQAVKQEAKSKVKKISQVKQKLAPQKQPVAQEHKEEVKKESIKKVNHSSIASLINDHKKNYNDIHAIYAIHHNGELIIKDSTGYKNFENKELMKVDEQMPIASGTKTMTAALILKAQEDGLLNVQDTVSKYLNEKSYYWGGKMPDWANDVTIHHLLTHSSGISEYLGQIKIDIKSNHKAVNKLIATHVAQRPVEFNPGERYSYNNSGYVLLGLILEQVHQKKLSKIFYDEIFKPLNMKSTRIPDIKEAITYNSNELAQYPTRYFVAEDPKGDAMFIKIKTPIMLVPNADGGVMSNIDDMTVWLSALHGGKFLSEESYEQMTSEHLKGERAHPKYGSIGYGLYIKKIKNNKTLYHHGGRALGIRAELGYIKENNSLIAMLSNVQELDNKCESKKCKVDVSYLNDKIADYLAEY